MLRHTLAVPVLLLVSAVLAADAHARGELVMGGAFADPADRVLMVFRGDARSVAENFARSDNYVTQGLVKRWEVRPWTVVIGADAAPPAPAKT